MLCPLRPCSTVSSLSHSFSIFLFRAPTPALFTLLRPSLCGAGILTLHASLWLVFPSHSSSLKEQHVSSRCTPNSCLASPASDTGTDICKGTSSLRGTQAGQCPARPTSSQFPYDWLLCLTVFMLGLQGFHSWVAYHTHVTWHLCQPHQVWHHTYSFHLWNSTRLFCEDSVPIRHCGRDCRMWISVLRTWNMNFTLCKFLFWNPVAVKLFWVSMPLSVKWEELQYCPSKSSHLVPKTLFF